MGWTARVRSRASGWKFSSLLRVQSITVFCPRAGLSLQTKNSPLHPLLSLPFRIFIQSIYHNVVYHLISSSASNLLPIYQTFQSILQQAVPSQPVSSQFIFLFLISSSIILPSPTLSSTSAFLFYLSILYAPSFPISTSQILPVVFAHSVVVSKSLNHITLQSTQSTSLASSLVIFPNAKGQHIYTNI